MYEIEYDVSFLLLLLLLLFLFAAKINIDLVSGGKEEASKGLVAFALVSLKLQTTDRKLPCLYYPTFGTKL